MKFFKRDLKKSSKYYIREGKVPGVIYGPGFENLIIYADKKDFIKFYKEHEFGLFDFEIEDKKFKGIIKEVQTHPVNDEIIHFDIYVPSLEEKIETTVPLEFIGEAPASKKGGLINFVLKELEVECLPEDLPDKIIVDISILEEIGQTIYVRDLNISNKIKVLIDESTPVASVIEEEVEEEFQTSASLNE